MSIHFPSKFNVRVILFNPTRLFSINTPRSYYPYSVLNTVVFYLDNIPAQTISQKPEFYLIVTLDRLHNENVLCTKSWTWALFRKKDKKELNVKNLTKCFGSTIKPQGLKFSKFSTIRMVHTVWSIRSNIFEILNFYNFSE